MGRQRQRQCTGIASFIFGAFLTSYLNRRCPNSALHGLDARQAMIAVSFGRVLGLIAMAVFFGYYAYTLWHL